ncbi:MAG: hypothetical protein FRX49_06798 [Trebouxia sp. A1-2]|nr:MAG: hypothetical protein FRX49_06798 [Trebouxia sp. A1-2]
MADPSHVSKHADPDWFHLVQVNLRANRLQPKGVPQHCHGRIVLASHITYLSVWPKVPAKGYQSDFPSNFHISLGLSYTTFTTTGSTRSLECYMKCFRTPEYGEGGHTLASYATGGRFQGPETFPKKNRFQTETGCRERQKLKQQGEYQPFLRATALHESRRLN